MTDLTRRGFLGRIAAAVSAAATLEVDPERALWHPGQKTIIDLGATPRLVTPTLAQTEFLARPAGIIREDLPMAQRYVNRRALYMPDRYVLTTIGGEPAQVRQLWFDSDWRPTGGTIDGRPLTDRDKAQIASDLARNRSRKINLRDFTFTD